MRHHTPTSRQQGFTLIELLVVIAIIAVLAALTIPSYAAAQRKPYDAAAMQCARAIVAGEIQYKVTNGAYATSVAALGEDPVEVCTGIEVHSTNAGITPNASTAGNAAIAVTASSYAFLVWSQKGRSSFWTNSATATKMALQNQW